MLSFIQDYLNFDKEIAKMKNKLSHYILISILFHNVCFAADKEIAITIDDLPFVGTNSYDKGNLKRSHDRFMKIVDALVQNQVPATGFVIAGSIGEGQWELLEIFRKEGFGLGNHTYSHANLNRLTAAQYTDEIAHADKILAPIITQPKYFRYPYLAEGAGEKKQQVQDYLAANQYIIAPVTIDSKDYMFNERLLRINWRDRNSHLNQIKQQYLSYIWNQTAKAEKKANGREVKQILLVHSNLLNSHFLADVIQMYKQHGYRFISLNEALTNTAPPLLGAPEESKPAEKSNMQVTPNDKISATDEWLTSFENTW